MALADSFDGVLHGDGVTKGSERDMFSAEPSEGAGEEERSSVTRGIRDVMNLGACTVPDLDVLVVEVVVSLSSSVMVVTMVVVVVETVFTSSDTSTTYSVGDGGGEAVADADTATTLGALI